MEGPSEEHESSAMACLTRTPPDASPSRPIFMPRVRITVRLARVTASRAAATTSLNFNLESTPKLRASGAKFLSMPWEGRRGKAELSKLRIAVLRRSISAAYSSAKLPIAALRRSIRAAHWLCSSRRSSTESCRAAARSELASSLMASSSLFQTSEAAPKILSLMARPIRTADFCQGMWRTWERQTACKAQPLSRLAHTMLSYWPALASRCQLAMLSALPLHSPALPISAPRLLSSCLALVTGRWPVASDQPEGGGSHGFHAWLHAIRVLGRSVAHRAIGPREDSPVARRASHARPRPLPDHISCRCCYHLGLAVLR